MKKKLVALAEYMVNENQTDFLANLSDHRTAKWFCFETASNSSEQLVFEGVDYDPCMTKSFFALILSEAYTTLK